MIRLVLFDFDGTLVDSNFVKERCMRAVVAGLPGGLAALEKAREIGGNRYKLFAEVARLLDPAREAKALPRPAERWRRRTPNAATAASWFSTLAQIACAATIWIC